MFKRKSIRLKNWDYASEGAYFITLLVKNRKRLFGEITNNEVKLSVLGEIVRNEWLKTPDLRVNVVLDEFIIMPDHMHAIIIITDNLSLKHDVNKGANWSLQLIHWVRLCGDLKEL